VLKPEARLSPDNRGRPQGGHVGVSAGRRAADRRADQPTQASLPASLLHSQFETLEEPAEDEHAVLVPLHGSVAETVIGLLHKIAALQGHGDAADVKTAVASPIAGRQA
jgi:hypothetical protein